MKDNNDKIIKDAQYRKGLSIAFFNATNNATQILDLIYGAAGNPQNHPDVIKKDVIFWRDWLLEEHKNYYATVIANVGVNYRADESIAKLKAGKTLEDLQTTWRFFSEDERRDGEIIKVAKELRQKYNEKA